ncbi:hypothetical protein LTR74_006493 [Friedmanniomyces endolithicus]|nr:hypothetical protein LTR74_006493 [Friedmanniomyces endolithicus]
MASGLSASRSPPSRVDNCPTAELFNALSAAILCSRSGFFDGACGSAFAEADSRVIDLSEDDEEAVNLMIHCTLGEDVSTCNFAHYRPVFYHLDYLNEPAQPPATVFRHRALSDARKKLLQKLDLSLDGNESLDSSAKVPRSPTRRRAQTPPLILDGESDYESYDEEEQLPEDQANLVIHARVYALAEKYDIPSLKHIAKQKLEMAMACNYDSPDLPLAIEEVYCSTIDTDRGLRDIVCEAFRCHPQLASTPDVRQAISELPSLALDLFKIERGIPV